MKNQKQIEDIIIILIETISNCRHSIYMGKQEQVEQYLQLLKIEIELLNKLNI